MVLEVIYEQTHTEGMASAKALRQERALPTKALRVGPGCGLAGDEGWGWEWCSFWGDLWAWAAV